MSYIEIKFNTDNDGFRLERDISCPECGSGDVEHDPEFVECTECGHQRSGALDIYAVQETLREVIEHLPLYGRPGEHAVRDANGNTVGYIRIHEEWS